ncbi:helix-turn-helix domain-containing protein [Pararhizobium mangrovi]|uniref:Helix-turn-helix domain-containing protein n=1 Tax=Pararhizobium mangrovi TaxID=2590452 RepID=A0A506U056_9HYPH|nr:helix-turn-helix domain-containing protein [Pararhizobium mangrovi]TPW26838.1 helix-turn-helix domain-containing protein [Pararhizobium mangrovi]
MADVYTPRTLAAEMACSERHVRNLIASGQLRAFRFGGKLLRIPKDAVEEFIECQNTVSGSSEEDGAPSDTSRANDSAVRLVRLTR